MLRKPKTQRRMPGRRTEAQEKAFRIFKLRGLHSLTGLLTGERRLHARALIDEEITLLGGEPQAFRDARRHAEMEAYFAAADTNKEFEEVA